MIETVGAVPYGLLSHESRTWLSSTGRQAPAATKASQGAWGSVPRLPEQAVQNDSASACPIRTDAFVADLSPVRLTVGHLMIPIDNDNGG
jgi:hypothetical protein